MSPLSNVADTDTNPAEEKILKRGKAFIEKNFKDQVAYGLKLHNKYEALTNEDILTTSLPLRDDIPERVRKRVLEYRKRTVEILFGVAANIQDEKFKPLDREIKSSGLSRYQERRYEKVRDAQKDIYASYDSIRQSINYITEFNQEIVDRVDQAKGKERTNLLLLNAVIVYELTDAIIEMINDFQLRGRDTLKSIGGEVYEELQRQHQDDVELWERAGQGSDEVKRRVRESVEERARIREAITEKWSGMWKKIEKLELRMGEAKGFIPTLELIRDNARGQINILEVIGITQIVESNIKNFQEICEITNIELAPLTKTDVYELIGPVGELESADPPARMADKKLLEGEATGPE